jgi:hypothetical protein
MLAQKDAELREQEAIMAAVLEQQSRSNGVSSGTASTGAASASLTHSHASAAAAQDWSPAPSTSSNATGAGSAKTSRMSFRKTPAVVVSSGHSDESLTPLTSPLINSSGSDEGDAGTGAATAAAHEPPGVVNRTPSRGLNINNNAHAAADARSSMVTDRAARVAVAAASAGSYGSGAGAAAGGGSLHGPSASHGGVAVSVSNPLPAALQQAQAGYAPTMATAAVPMGSPIISQQPQQHFMATTGSVPHPAPGAVVVNVMGSNNNSSGAGAGAAGYGRGTSASMMLSDEELARRLQVCMNHTMRLLSFT